MSVTEQIIERSEKLLKELQTERGSIQVQLHLLNMDAKDEWNELEKKYQKFKIKASAVAEVTADSAGEVGEAIKLVGEELQEGYKRIRDSI
ncbi:MAG: hypothetical protein DRQ44_09695 [Gammaproteobacteria bacterium]|nr:MAG: hypothetical protein DRQ44_09695 [Gammaproteobacteria bacterium]